MCLLFFPSSRPACAPAEPKDIAPASATYRSHRTRKESWQFNWSRRMIAHVDEVGLQGPAYLR